MSGALLASLLLASAGASAGAGESAQARPAVLREVGFDQRLGEAVPLDLVFRDENGRTVRLGDYFGRKPVVLTFVYYACPMLCTVTLNGLASALDLVSFDVGKQFEVVTVSFDPREGPELAASKKKAQLTRYRRPGAEKGWHFLTGEASSIDRLARAVGFRYVWDEETKQFAHPAGSVVLTADGHIARYIFGVEYAPKDLRLALVEASAGRIGSPVDQFLLYCYHYDPATGRYNAVVMNIMRLGGVLTILALGSFVLLMWRRERAARRQRERAS